MRAVVIYEPGGPEKLVYTEIPTPDVKDGWSLVRVRGFGINHSEVFTRNGLSPTVTFPRVLGIECVGEIAESTDPKRLPPGQKVISIMGEMGRDFDGSYAEYALLPNTQLYPVDTDMDWTQLAAIPETYFTAYGSLKNLKLHPTDRILVRGATSGVGVAFLRLVKGLFPNARVSGTSRRVDKADLLRKEGFDQVFEDRDGVLQTADIFDKVLELVGPATLRDTFQHVCEEGVVCSTGQLGGQWYLDRFEPIMELPANGYLTSFYSGNVSADRIQEMLDFVRDYNVDAKPEKIFSLEQVPDAHRYLESSDSYGKVVCVVASCV